MKNDQETRVAITKDLKHNFFVEAGAGSGKTSCSQRKTGCGEGTCGAQGCHLRFGALARRLRAGSLKQCGALLAQRGCLPSDRVDLEVDDRDRRR